MLKNKLSQYKEKDNNAINVYLRLSIFGGVILFFFGMGSYSETGSIYIIAISIASVLIAIIFAGIASDIRETRNILLQVANKVAEKNNGTDSE